MEQWGRAIEKTYIFDDDLIGLAQKNCLSSYKNNAYFSWKKEMTKHQSDTMKILARSHFLSLDGRWMNLEILSKGSS